MQEFLYDQFSTSSSDDIIKLSQCSSIFSSFFELDDFWNKRASINGIAATLDSFTIKDALRKIKNLENPKYIFTQIFDVDW